MPKKNWGRGWGGDRQQQGGDSVDNQSGQQGRGGRGSGACGGGYLLLATIIKEDNSHYRKLLKMITSSLAGVVDKVALRHLLGHPINQQEDNFTIKEPLGDKTGDLISDPILHRGVEDTMLVIQTFQLVTSSEVIKGVSNQIEAVEIFSSDKTEEEVPKTSQGISETFRTEISSFKMQDNLTEVIGMLVLVSFKDTVLLKHHQVWFLATRKAMGNHLSRVGVPPRKPLKR